MKHQWILGLILTVGGAGLHAQQYAVRMTFTGSAAYLAPQMSLGPKLKAEFHLWERDSCFLRSKILQSPNP